MKTALSVGLALILSFGPFAPTAEAGKCGPDLVCAPGQVCTGWFGASPLPSENFRCEVDSAPACPDEFPYGPVEMPLLSAENASSMATQAEQLTGSKYASAIAVSRGKSDGYYYYCFSPCPENYLDGPHEYAMPCYEGLESDPEGFVQKMIESSIGDDALVIRVILATRCDGPDPGCAACWEEPTGIPFVSRTVWMHQTGGGVYCRKKSYTPPAPLPDPQCKIICPNGDTYECVNNASHCYSDAWDGKALRCDEAGFRDGIVGEIIPNLSDPEHSATFIRCPGDEPPVDYESPTPTPEVPEEWETPPPPPVMETPPSANTPDAVVDHPESSHVPGKPRVQVRRKTARIVMDNYSNASYQIHYRQIGAPEWRTRNSTSNITRLVNLRGGQYAISYRIHTGTTTTKWSKVKKLKIP